MGTYGTEATMGNAIPVTVEGDHFPLLFSPESAGIE